MFRSKLTKWVILATVGLTAVPVLAGTVRHYRSIKHPAKTAVVKTTVKKPVSSVSTTKKPVTSFSTVKKPVTHVVTTKKPVTHAVTTKKPVTKTTPVKTSKPAPKTTPVKTLTPLPLKSGTSVSPIKPWAM